MARDFNAAESIFSDFASASRYGLGWWKGRDVNAGLYYLYSVLRRKFGSGRSSVRVWGKLLKRLISVLESRFLVGPAASPGVSTINNSRITDSGYED